MLLHGHMPVSHYNTPFIPSLWEQDVPVNVPQRWLTLNQGHCKRSSCCVLFCGSAAVDLTISERKQNIYIRRWGVRWAHTMLLWRPRLMYSSGFFPHIILLLSLYSSSLYYLQSQRFDEGKKPSSEAGVTYFSATLPLEVLSLVCLSVICEFKAFGGGVTSIDTCIFCRSCAGFDQEHAFLLKYMTVASVANGDMSHPINHLWAENRTYCTFLKRNDEMDVQCPLLGNGCSNNTFQWRSYKRVTDFIR